MTAGFDVLGIGNALVDVLAHEDNDFPARAGLESGAMTIVDLDRSDAVYAALGPGIEVSGGSAANTTAGVASFGGAAAFIGRVRDDELGAVFRHDLNAAGVHYSTPPTTDGPMTGRCLVAVTPDAQRTMCTYLGISTQLCPGDIDLDLIASASVTYLEGYLWDEPAAKEAFRRAAGHARQAGRRVALSLSDPFCVDRHRDTFHDLVEEHVDIVFANEEEICSLYEVESFEKALVHVRDHCELAALTRGERGSVVVSSHDVHEIGIAPVPEVVDTTGAGDLYAAGFLYGLTHGHALTDCGRLGALAAAEIVSHLGARPEHALADLL